MHEHLPISLDGGIGLFGLLVVLSSLPRLPEDVGQVSILTVLGMPVRGLLRVTGVQRSQG